jgi:hypothetical protein
MKRDAIAEAKHPEPVSQVEFPSIGVGILRSTASYIVLFLTLEHPDSRASIIADAMRELGVKLEDVADQMDRTMCPKCHLDLQSLCTRRGYCER